MIGTCSRVAIPTVAPYRIVNRLDLVPEMPLASIKRLLPKVPRFTPAKVLEPLKQMAARVPCYGHVNTLVYINGDGVVSTDADVEPWHLHAVARAIATRGKSFHEGITDHLIANYIRGLAGETGKNAKSRKPVTVQRRTSERR